MGRGNKHPDSIEAQHGPAAVACRGVGGAWPARGGGYGGQRAHPRPFRDVGQPASLHDEVAWCAAFVGACLERAGLASTRSLMARSYSRWGAPLDAGRCGAVAVLSRGGDPSAGHVGFLVGETASHVVLLGGNQGDAVSVAAFPKARLVGLRWPQEQPMVAPEKPSPPALADAALFARALAHVLEMEGGYTDDPYDPGGPTNRGITLRVYAAWKNVPVDAASSASLKEELQRIPDAVVRDIYAGPLLDAGALRRAARRARLLPLRRRRQSRHHRGDAAAAARRRHRPRRRDGPPHACRHRRPPRRGRAAALRRDAPRPLSRPAALLALRARVAGARRYSPGACPRHSRRVDARCRHNSNSHNPRERTSSHDRPRAQTRNRQPNGGGQSITIWGAIITGLSTVLPALGPAFGIDITGDLVQQAGDGLVQTVQAIGGLIGTIMTIYGRDLRPRACQPAAAAAQRADEAVKRIHDEFRRVAAKRRDVP